MAERVVVTGMGAICAAGKSPGEIWERVRAGRSAVAQIMQWDTSRWPRRLGGEVADFDPLALVENRKVHKFVRRTDILGLYAAGRALDAAGFTTQRERLDAAEAEIFNDRTGVFVGSGAGSYQDQYDFFPLLTRAEGNVTRFGSELMQAVNPLWLLRVLPNNVLCHMGIIYGFRGPNACISNHSLSGMLAVAEAAAALRSGEVDRAIAVGHQSPVEPQAVQYFDSLGLLTADAVRPFDARRSGCVLGEGAAALALETETAVRARRARVVGEVLGSGCTSEAGGLLAVRADGDGLARAIEVALDAAGLRAADVGMIVAHGNATAHSDASEAAAIRSVFGAAVPPVTAFKWAYGHVLAASGIVDAVLALLALHGGEAPGIATLREPAADCAGLPVSKMPQVARGDVALVLSRGFGGLNAALLLRGGGEERRG